MLEALRDGGPRNREGGGARWGWEADADAELGERVDIAMESGIECNVGQVQSLSGSRHESHAPDDLHPQSMQLSVSDQSHCLDEILTKPPFRV